MRDMTDAHSRRPRPQRHELDITSPLVKPGFLRLSAGRYPRRHGASIDAMSSTLRHYIDRLISTYYFHDAYGHAAHTPSRQYTLELFDAFKEISICFYILTKITPLMQMNARMMRFRLFSLILLREPIKRDGGTSTHAPRTKQYRPTRYRRSIPPSHGLSPSSRYQQQKQHDNIRDILDLIEVSPSGASIAFH